MSQVNKRKGHRGQATHLIKNISDELEKPSPSFELLESYNQELKRQRDLLVDLDCQIQETFATEQEVCSDITDSSNRMIKISLALNKISRFLSTRQEEDRQVHNQKNVKLPQLTLNKFNGDPLEWLNFWDLFRTSVHERSDLSKPIKFQYLIGQLQDEAAHLLSGFNLTPSEYDEAIDLLKKTYGQKRLLVQVRLNALFDIQPPLPTLSSLSDFRSQYEGHLRVLKSLDMEIDSSGYIFAHMLLRKLPASTRDHLNRANKSEVWTIADLRAGITDKIHLLTSLEDYASHGKNFENAQNISSSHPSAAFPVSTKSYKSKKYSACPLCNEDHYVLRCKKYATPLERKDFAYKLRLCMNCLSNSHKTSACLSKERCKHCSSKHHTGLCIKMMNDFDAKTEGYKKPDETKTDVLKSAVFMANGNGPDANRGVSIMPTVNITIQGLHKSYD